MRKTIIIILLLLGLGGGLYWYYVSSSQNIFSNGISSSDRTYPESLDNSFYIISELNAGFLSGVRYNTEGYVVKRYECPKCPTGAMCKMKPCMGDNIVISESDKIVDDYSVTTNKEMVVFVNNPGQFDLGKKYTYTIDFRYNNPRNEYELVGYSEIK